MAFGKGLPLRAADYTALKAKVKAEVSRRDKTGSIVSYAGAAYDYTYTPANNQPIRAEHSTKIITPAAAIKPISGITAITTNQPSPDLSAVDTFINAVSTRPVMDNTGTDCQSSCTGLCYSCTGNCTGGCEGCGSGCARGCYYSCYGTCDDSCEYCGQDCAWGASMASLVVDDAKL